ncbi:hypothetical protein J132_08135 [Termitomyces sp. J132]|nr:hypothetical protein J132_08135 [Termitomyces sp. J132]
MERLGRVQRTCALQMLGALRTTPNDMLEAHVGLVLMGIRIKKMCVGVAARIAVMPDMHPLYKPVRRAARSIRQHQAPLHEIMRALGEKPDDMETIAIVRHPPEWECPIEVDIDSSVEEVEERERHNKADITVYMDGSGHKGKIGVVAVLYRGFRKEVKVMRKCLGSEEKHTVFKGECVGQMLGLELLRREVRQEVRAKRRVRDTTIGMDNQAGMQMLEDSGPGMARYLVDAVEKYLPPLHSSSLINSGTVFGNGSLPCTINYLLMGTFTKKTSLPMIPTHSFAFAV